MTIICNGMMRSGSTLQYNWVESLLTGNKDFSKGKGFLEPDKIYAEMENSENEIILVKSHEILNLNYRDDSYKILYVWRDMRDVALSLITKEKLTDEHLINRLDSQYAVYKKMMKLKGSRNILIQKYEDLINHASNSINEINIFIKTNKSSADIEKILNIYDINAVEKRIMKTQKKEKTKLLLNKKFKELPYSIKEVSRKIGLTYIIRQIIPSIILVEGTQYHSNHISNSKGKIGGWKGNLDAKVIKKIELRYPELCEKK